MDELAERMIRIVPATGVNMTDLMKAAHGDGHEVMFPTHVIEKSGEIVGALSLNSVPTVLHWMHTKKANIRDSMCAMNFFENVVGAGTFLLPCSEKSPYLPLLSRVGYVDAGSFRMFVKKPR